MNNVGCPATSTGLMELKSMVADIIITNDLGPDINSNEEVAELEFPNIFDSLDTDLNP